MNAPYWTKRTSGEVRKVEIRGPGVEVRLHINDAGEIVYDYLEGVEADTVHEILAGIHWDKGPQDIARHVLGAWMAAGLVKVTGVTATVGQWGHSAYA